MCQTFIRDAAEFVIGVAPGRSIDDYRSDRQIIAFRHVLIHGHDLIDHRIAWSTIQEELPGLMAEVESLLARRL